jgi:ABC-type lipoprotein release transport system permease subunit
MGNVQLIGIDTEKEKSVSVLYKTIPDSLGSYFVETAPNSIIVGSKFAEKFKVKLGNKVVISFADNEGEPFSAAFRVCGIYQTNNAILDEIKIYTKINDLREICPIPQNSIHELAIRLDNNNDAVCDSTKEKVTAMLSDGEIVRKWTEINPVIGMYNSFMKTIFSTVIIIILIALGFGIVNTVLMSVMERKRELCMLMAIGMNRRKVMMLIISESTVLTLLGGLLGLFLGALTVFITGRTGLDLSSSLSSYSVIGVSSLVYPTITLQQSIQIIIMVIITGIISAIYPARVAVRMKPAEGVRS